MLLLPQIIAPATVPLYSLSPGCLDLAKQRRGHLRQALAAGDGSQVLESQPLAAGFHASLIVSLTGPGKARLEQVVADQRLETLGELGEKPHPAFHRRRQVVVDNPAWQTG